MGDPPSLSQLISPVGLTGSYRWKMCDDSWDWSPELCLLHGLDPISTHPSTDLLLSRKHPDDLPYALEVIARVKRTGGPFSCQHRIIRADGEIRRVIVVGEVELDSHGEAVLMRGYFIDITDQLGVMAGQAMGQPVDQPMAVENRKLQGQLLQARTALEELHFESVMVSGTAGGRSTQAYEDDILKILRTCPLRGVRLVGEVDLTNVSALDREVRSLAERGEDLYLDLSELNFISVRGMAMLIEVARELPEHRRLILDSPNPVVRIVLNLCWEKPPNLLIITREQQLAPTVPPSGEP